LLQGGSIRIGQAPDGAPLWRFGLRPAIFQGFLRLPFSRVTGMATTRKATATTAIPATGDPDAQPFFTPQRIRIFGIAGAAVLVIGLVAWFMVAAGQRKQAFAAEALEQARDAAAQQNWGVAVQGFTRVASSYSGTPAAYEANLGLAQAKLVAGQNELAISTLEAFLKTNPPPTYASPANNLLGTAYENMGKFAEAEAAYRKGSDLATVDYLKASSLLDAGRAARLANKADEAKSIYTEIVTKYAKTAAYSEAQVRLAELTAHS
jgi:tetratricopeptide (TPR) repeat protein